MRDKEYRENKLKHQLRQYEVDGKQQLLWNLKKGQVEYIRSLGYNVEETLFYINTRRFPRFLREDNPLLKDLHYASCEGKRTIARKLSSGEKELLYGFGVNFTVLKYTINLQRRKYRR